MLRRFLLKQADIVAQGGDPAGISFDASAPPIRSEAGNFLVDG